MQLVFVKRSSSPKRVVNFSKGLLNLFLLLVTQRVWNLVIFGLLLFIAQNLSVARDWMISLKEGVFIMLNTAWSGVCRGTLSMPLSVLIWHW